MSTPSQDGSPGSALEEGRTVSHFRLAEKIGQGGMGVVYRAEDLTLGRSVAIKFLSLARLETFSERILDELKRRFIQEARLLARANHRHLVAVYEADFDENLPYLVMEYVDGISLKARHLQEPAVTIAEACQIMSQTASALGFAYRKFGIIHRDLKPSNILLTPDLGVKILDLGLAKVVAGDAASAAITADGRAVGTPPYMAPEQFRSDAPVDHRSDMYALGVTMYQVLSRRLPFVGKTPREICLAKMEGVIPPLGNYVSDPPPKLVRLLESMLAVQVDDRPASYKKIEKALSGLIAKYETPAAGNVALTATEVRPSRPVEQVRKEGLAAAAGAGGSGRGPAIRIGPHPGIREIPQEETVSGRDQDGQATVTYSQFLPSSQRVLQRIVPGMTVGGYRVKDRIGVGGMGVVHRAVHLSTGEDVAMKFLVSGDQAAASQQLEEIEREAGLIGRLEHPSIVKVRETSCQGGVPFMVMELFLGPYGKPVNLEDYGNEFGKGTGVLDEADLKQIMLALLQAIGYAHTNGVVHCDLKPANILFKYAGTEGEHWGAYLKLTDFGVAKLVGEDTVRNTINQSLTRQFTGEAATADAKALIGTFEYMSPEQRRGENAIPASDIYAIGMMMFRLLTGHGEPGLTRPSSIRSDIKPEWDGILKKALQEKPEKRFASAKELHDAVESV